MGPEYALSFGAFLAGRWDAMRFGEIADSTGARHPWDSDVTRLEAGVGYRFNRDAVAKVVYQRSEIEREVPVRETLRPVIVAGQLSVTF